MRHAFGTTCHLVLVVALFCPFLSHCQSASRKGQSIELEQDAYVSQGNEAPVMHKKGEKISVISPLYVTAPGYQSVLVLPSTLYEGQTKLALVSLKDTKNYAAVCGNEMSEAANELMARESDVLHLLGEGKNQEALSQLEELEVRYPQITYLKFLKASALFLLGEREKAKGTLDAALKASPTDPEGLALMKVLEGKQVLRTPANVKSGESKGRQQ